MKRVWIGAGVLAVLLTVGILAGWAMDRGLCPGAAKLELAGSMAAAGRWEAAEELLEDVEDAWEDRRWLVTALYDHEIVDETDAALAQLEVYCEARDTLAFRALCNALAQNVEAAGKAHRGTVENFLCLSAGYPPRLSSRAK